MAIAVALYLSGRASSPVTVEIGNLFTSIVQPVNGYWVYQLSTSDDDSLPRRGLVVKSTVDDKTITYILRRGELDQIGTYVVDQTVDPDGQPPPDTTPNNVVVTSITAGIVDSSVHTITWQSTIPREYEVWVKASYNTDFSDYFSNTRHVGVNSAVLTGYINNSIMYVEVRTVPVNSAGGPNYGQPITHGKQTYQLNVIIP